MWSGEDISLSVSQVLSYRRFCNKIWQTVRFTLGVLGNGAHQLDTLAEVGTFIQGFLAKKFSWESFFIFSYAMYIYIYIYIRAIKRLKCLIALMP